MTNQEDETKKIVSYNETIDEEDNYKFGSKKTANKATQSMEMVKDEAYFEN